MIDWLQIRNFAIADSVDLRFENGFTTVTGETGSGKSLMVDALALLLGSRSDNSFIKHACDAAEIQAGFAIDAAHPALEWLRQNQLASGEECQLRRVLQRDKPSRGYINGRGVNISQLRELGDLLVDIHGQHEHHALLTAGAQRRLLDHAAGNQQLLADLEQHYRRLMDAREQLQQLKNKTQNARERMDWLQFQLTELDALQPNAKEWPQLEKNQKRMHHLRDIILGGREVTAKLCEAEDNLLDRIQECITQLQTLGKIDADLNPVAGMLEESAVLINEAVQSLRALDGEEELSPEDARQLEQRFSAYFDLARKHRVSPESLQEKHLELQSELDTIRDPHVELERLTKLEEAEAAEYARIAAELSARRAEAGKRLAREVTELMQELGMRGGQFAPELEKLPEGKISPNGLESVRFLVSANPGQPLRALNRVASGGELSRISLAICVILADRAPVTTLIFDEVDIGVGGAVADIVGRKLKQLGQNRQAVCITHLAQVAALGDDHLRVSKGGEAQVSVNVARLDKDQRVEEIARMSGGEKITPQSLAHAQQMLGAA